MRRRFEGCIDAVRINVTGRTGLCYRINNAVVEYTPHIETRNAMAGTTIDVHDWMTSNLISRTEPTTSGIVAEITPVIYNLWADAVVGISRSKGYRGMAVATVTSGIRMRRCRIG